MSHSVAALVAVAAILLGFPVRPASGQDAIVNPDPLCRSCRIEVQEILTLGVGEEADRIGPANLIEHDRRGRYYVVFWHAPSEVVVFDSSGRLLATIGSPGEGPGEFRGISAIAVAEGDTLHLFDNALGRRTVLSPTYEVMRTAPVRAPVTAGGVFVFTDGRVLVHGVLATAKAIGLPLHLLDPQGWVQRSFGADDRSLLVAPGQLEAATVRQVTSAGNGRVWTIPWREYRAELWDTAGVKLIGLVRSVDWFEGWAQPRSEITEPPPDMGPVWWDPRGLLWVAARLASTDWQKIPRSSGADGAFWAIGDLHRIYDTVVEIIDPTRKRVVARTRIDRMAFQVTHDGYYWRYRETTSAHPQIDIWRLTLTH